MPRFASLSGSYAANETRSTTLDPGLADTLTGLVWADQSGSLTISYSSDGSNWDFSEGNVTVVPNTGQKVSFSVVAPYVRATYTNGAGAANVRCSLRFASAGPR